MAAFLEGILAKCMLAFGRWCLLGIYPEEILSRFQGRIINGVHHRTILTVKTHAKIFTVHISGLLGYYLDTFFPNF